MSNKFMRWFYGLLGFILLYTGTQTRLRGGSAAAAAEYVVALGCFLAVLYYAIDARIAQLEDKLTKEGKVAPPTE